MGIILKVEPGRKPRLIRYAPPDYWYEQQPLGTPFWLDGFELIEVTSVDAGWDALGRPARAAYIGNETGRAEVVLHRGLPEVVGELGHLSTIVSRMRSRSVHE